MCSVANNTCSSPYPPFRRISPIPFTHCVSLLVSSVTALLLYFCLYLYLYSYLLLAPLPPPSLYLLHFTAGHTKVVRVLLDLAGADPDQATEATEANGAEALTPLHVAAVRGHTEVVRALLGDVRTRPGRGDRDGYVEKSLYYSGPSV